MIDKLDRRDRVETVRINSEDFAVNSAVTLTLGESTRSGKLRITDSRRSIEIDRIRSVWFRHPSDPTVPKLVDGQDQRFAVAQSKETLVGFLHATSDVMWMNSPSFERSAENKISQAVAAMKVGLKVPEHVVTNEPLVAHEFIVKAPTIYKPLLHAAFSTTEADTAMRTSPTMLVTQDHLEHIEGVRYSPALFQRWIPKYKEYRVTVVGERCFTAEIDPHQSLGGEIDWREAQENVHMEASSLKPTLNAALVQLVHSFGLNYAAIDLILGEDGEYYFLDLNPSGQFLFVEDAVEGLAISDAICAMLEQT